MIALTLLGIGSLFGEIGSSIGKWQAAHKKEGIFLMGFLELFWGTFFFFCIAFFRGTFDFSLTSLPTFMPRVILEILLMTSAMLAVQKAERTAIGFLTVGTLPLLLVVDIFLGYTISLKEIIGISIIIITLLILFLNHGISKKGVGYIIFTTISSVATLSLYKYDITHFNSVEAEQGITYLILLIYFGITSILINKQNPFSYIFKYPFAIQSISLGAGAVLVSFSYLFAPASIITSGKRAFRAMVTIVFGGRYFKEKKIPIKIGGLLFIILGLTLLV